MTEQKNNKNNTYRLVLSAVMVAMATVLSFIQPYSLPMGGSVTLFSMVPIIVVAWLYGTKWGLLTGGVMSIIQLLFGFSNFGYVSGFVAYLVLIFADYVCPFTLLGLGGIFRGHIKNNTLAISLGALLVCFLRFLCHFISGITIWASWADNKTWKAVILYSLTYNGSYMLPETIITIVGCVLLSLFLFPRLDENGRLVQKKK